MLSWWFSSLFQNRQLNFPYFQKIDDDGQKMAKAAMAVVGIDQLDQNPREAWKPQQFRPAQHLQQPTGRSGGGVPRPFSAALRLATSTHRASGDDSERRGGLIQSAPASQSCHT